MSHFFTSGGQSIGVSASASVLPVNIRDRFSLGWTGWISLQSKGLSRRVFSNTTVQKINSPAISFLYGPTLTSIHDYWKNHSISKVMSLLFYTLSKFVIAFLPRSKCLSVSWLPSPYAVTLEPKKTKSVTVSIVSPSICHEVMGLAAMTFVF